ncbi:MAG: FHA domain-containing protein [Anaerolineaceae bacterium]|nr:MAG: FHA domain-containing protein [Anaerolineaceae bacterium]
MDVSYKKDIHHNYLVIPKISDSKDEAYCVCMLEANSIDSIIGPEPRTIDNKVLYYYDITAKQSIDTIYVKNTINYEQLKRLFTSMADLIGQTYEYLLNENDLILEPEHIYIELASCRANICYLPGYNIDIGKQMAKLIEYLMNKVEYNDKEAVLYVYNLYAACREEGFSFNNLLSVIRESKGDKAKAPIVEARINKQIPVMMEKIYDERESYYYPVRTYIFSGASIVGAIMILAISINLKILHTSIGNRINYGKLMALIFILFILVGYLMKYIWNKNNRLTKIISKHEYIDPRIDDPRVDDSKIKYKIKAQTENNPEQSMAVSVKDFQINKSKDTNQSEDLSESTVLLNAKPSSFCCCFEPEDQDTYDIIQISDFPFLIGKQGSNVDYYLGKDVVSRYHVKVTKEEERYFITDLNTTNGTTLNDKLLPCYQRHEIVNEDKMAIAGIKYTFHIR